MGEINETNKNINFEDKALNGLRYVSDDTLKLCEYLLANGEVSLSAGKNGEVLIESNIINLCSKKHSTKDLLDAVENKKGILDENNIFQKTKSVFTLKGNMDNVCIGCRFQKCPKNIMGYIAYLKQKGEFDDKLKDREEFRKSNEVYDEFDFIWQFDEGLKRVPDKVFDFCNELVKKEMIWVTNSLNKEKRIIINSQLSCLDFRNIACDINGLRKKGWKNYTYLTRDTKNPIYLCSTYSCRLEACPMLVAGYIYYLKKIGREDKIQEERDYYHQNQERMNLENQKMIEDTIDKINEDRKKEVNNILSYKDRINNVNDLVDIIINKYQKNLHCTIEGDRGVGKTQFTKEIAKLLCKYGKINSENPQYLSMQNLAAQSVTLINTGYSVVKNIDILENELYVLTNISEFLHDYNLYKDGASGVGEYKEIRRKQFLNFIEVLTSLYLQHYIILVGTEKEINDLIALDPRLQFVYQSYRFKFPKVSLDEMFEIYSNSLKDSLMEILRENKEEYKNKFVDFVSLNEKFLPFSNIEIAKYLAMYSNFRNELVFPENIYKKESVEESLKNIIGLSNVKNKLKEFEQYMLFQVKAKANGINLANVNMHMVFTGNPGTGKTTIARIMAKMLYDLGIIRENKLIEVERKDLIAPYIGQTAPKTSEVIDKAMGGVLFIDEAYSLAQVKGSSSDFGAEAIATLIKAMEDHKGEFVVIFAGYKDEMKTFIDSNSGIASRIGYTFDFPDYTEEELLEIYKIKMKNMGFELSENLDNKLLGIFSYYSKRKMFGNGRFVDKLVQETIMKHSKNENEKITSISEADIPTIEELTNNDVQDTTEVDKLLNNVIGLEDLKKKIKDFESYVRFLKKAQNYEIDIAAQNMHMVFTGNPGTGKTTIARIMAKMLFDLGIIHENKLIEVERKDLIAGYVGQTAPKTSEVIEKAMGGVLFIDEAYSLTQGKGAQYDFGAEAIATLIKAMEDHKGEFVVIFAGYKKEMKDFVDSNPGIASRIGYTFDFPDYNDSELESILYKKIENTGMKIEESAKEDVKKVIKYFCNVDNIGNGRFVDKLLQEILMKHAKNNSDDIITIKQQDIPTIQEMTSCIFRGQSMIDPSKITEEAQKNTAIHEVGHAILRLILFKEPGIKKITINAEGTGTLGYVAHKGTSGYTQSKTELLNMIKVLLAGMGAEKVYLGEYCNGNTSDLEHATRIARNMVTRYGMSKFGLAQIENEDTELSQDVLKEVNEILEECFKDVINIITENKEKMDKVVDFLYNNKEISEEQLIENFK